MTVKKNLRNGMLHPLRRVIFRANQILGNYREVVWLVGAARSGTTWVSGLINYAKNYREMFEPFHPRFVPALEFMISQQYIRPHSLDQKTKTVAAAVFNGSFSDHRVDARASCFLHKGLLIKDITANLLCCAMSREFPHIRPVFLIRNPFAVALSKFNTRQWVWLTEPLEFLKQKDLYEDHLQPFEDIIRKTSAEKNYFLSQILIWAILHYVPLRQFESGEVHICFYEDIYTDPAREITRITRFVKGDQTIDTINLADTLVRQPSWVSGEQSNMVRGTSPITSWKNELDPEIITQGLAILEHFGLADLYRGDGIPHQEALKKIQGQNRL